MYCITVELIRLRNCLDRPSFVRNVQKLFVIATEGVKTEIKYFEQFKSEEYYNNQSVFIEVLKRLTTDSSPAVLSALSRRAHIVSGWRHQRPKIWPLHR